MLPKLETPSYTLLLPSNGKKIKYRGFTAKEEEILLQAKESKDTDAMMSAMMSVVDICTFGEVVGENSPVFDIEYIFLMLRAKSIGEITEIGMKCVHLKEDGETCKTRIDIEVDLNEVNVLHKPEHSNVVMLGKKVGIQFKYPTMILAKEIDSLQGLRSIIPLIDNIFDGDNVYPAKDIPAGELESYVMSFQRKQYKAIKNTFLTTMPALSHTVKYKCPACKHEDEYTFRGINDFFG